MTTVKGFAAGVDYLNRQGFPLQTALLPNQQTLDILVGDNDEPLIVVNPAVTSLDDSIPSGGDYGWAVFSSLCRETFKKVNTILYGEYICCLILYLIDIYHTRIDDSPERNHVDYESASRLDAPVTTLGPEENEDLELTLPNKPRRELWWTDPQYTFLPLSLDSIACRFDDFLASAPSSSLSPLRRLHNSDSEKRRSLHRCPGYLREEIVLSSDLARSAIISHSSPNAMERCNICGKLVSSGVGNDLECANFPKTQPSDKNVEVLKAWRSITSSPYFKDLDINELCTEFSSKARCDGTKVVLEPQAVDHILKRLSAMKK